LSIVALVIASLLAAMMLASRYQWAWAAPISRRWDHLGPVLRAYMRCSPATFTYLFILAVTTWVLRSSTVTVDRRLLLQHSTNLSRLRHDPISVLLTSASWVAPHELWLWAGLFPLVLAPAERWLGSIRVIVVFAPRPWRWGWIAAILAGALGFIARRTSFSDHGHLIAMLIGPPLYPLTRVPAVQVQASWPIWRPPTVMVDLEVECIEARRRLEAGSDA
jgi:hypothetical protein